MGLELRKELWSRADEAALFYGFIRSEPRVPAEVSEIDDRNNADGDPRSVGIFEILGVQRTRGFIAKWTAARRIHCERSSRTLRLATFSSTHAIGAR
jgi:hypothetical protein